jgi:hypothetical protein
MCNYSIREIFQNIFHNRAPVVQDYNPIYSGGINQEDQGLKQAPSK